MTSPVDQIKDRLDIVEVINGYVRLKKAGARHVALCPFHTEKTPSFTVTQEKQMWYCFGCGQGGDLFTFVEKIEGVEFADALRLLADKAGVKLERDDPKLRSRRKELYEIVEEATKFFSRQLESKAGKAVVTYLRERGLSDDSIQEWRLGYAPDNWRALHDYLYSKGYADAALEAAGLTIKSHDRFRHRVMFPIFDIQGQVIGFSGRIFDKVKSATVGEETGKYINTPNTLLYDKSRVLYGLNRAKEAIREKDRAVIIEGNLDLILAHQAGTKNAAAVFGTALTETQLTLIRRATANLTLCFDSDEAGERAARRAAGPAIQRGFDVSVVMLPEGKDGADVIREDAQRWQTIIVNPVPFVEFVLKRALERFSPTTLAGKKGAVSDVVGAITLLSSPVEREHWVRELAVQVGSTEAAIQEELRRVRTGAPQESPISETPPPITTEEYLLTLAAAYPKTKESFREIVELVESAEIRQIINDFLAGGDIETVLRRDGRFAPLLARSAFLKDMIEDGEAEVVQLCAELKRRAIKEKLRTIELDLKKAELARNDQETRTLTQQFTTLSRELSSRTKPRSRNGIRDEKVDKF